MAAQIELTQEAVSDKAGDKARDKASGAPRDPVSRTIEQAELRGISRTVAEIHWLLLILVLLYLVFGGVRDDAEEAAAVSSGLFFYGALVMSFRYANFYRSESRWKIAIETLGMIAFVTWVLWHTDRLASPLLNAYLLAVITSALTLGKAATLANVALIAGCYLFLGRSGAGDATSMRFLAGFAAQFAPVVLVAYITTMFSADIRYGLQRAKLLSETDDLTGLFNTRGFAIAANRLFGQAVRYDRPASVLMVDSDNLKGVNDAYGHDAGNRLLRHLAGAIQAELRATDVPARYGGDEFIVLLPETPVKGALDVAERIRKAISAMPLLVEGRPIACTVSVGVAAFPDDGRSLDTLAARADRALYQAKKDGRNRVARYEPASARVGSPTRL
jgi:diguanylate cyclase (GGDEF)-like protein